jgi:hypothetical protein
MSSLVPLSAFATNIFPKLQADISERVNLLPRFLAALGWSLCVLHLDSATAPLRFLASDPPPSCRLGELRDLFHEHYYDAVFRVAVRRIFGLSSSGIRSTLRSPTACASCHLSA